MIGASIKILMFTFIEDIPVKMVLLLEFANANSLTGSSNVIVFISPRNKLNEVNFTSTSEVMKRTNDMFDLFNSSYAKLSSFVKINQDAHIKRYSSVCNCRFST